MFKKPFISVFLAFILSFQFVFPVMANGVNIYEVKLSVQDTVASYPTAFKAFGLPADQNAAIAVETPTKSILKISTRSDHKGEIMQDIYGMQLGQSGQYCAWLIFPGTLQTSEKACFYVYPGQMSPYQSQVYADKNLATVGSEVLITAIIKDENGNPIPNHTVVPTSSRSSDSFTPVKGGGITDQNGKAQFYLKAGSPGVSIVAMFNTGTGDTIKGRVEVAFKEKEKEVGGNLFSSNLLGAQILDATQQAPPGPIDHFEIVGLPNQVKVNEFVSFTLRAVDANGNTASNYSGTVLLSTFDPNATLPANGEYTFKVSDQGEVNFDLALSFSQMGETTIMALDSENWNISGEQPITVVSANTVTSNGSVSNNGSNSSGSSVGAITIKSPTNGSEYGIANVTVSGQGPIFANVYVFVDDMKVGTTETDSDGFVNYQLTGLSNGAHTVYFMSNQQVSNTVNFKVDTVPPALINLNVTPDGPVSAGAALKVIAVSDDPNLDKAVVRLQGSEQPLFATDPGNYSTTVAAPAEPGQYSLDIILEDKLGNRAVLLGAKQITVQNAAPVAVPQVKQFNGEAKDGAVMLTWDPIEMNNLSIQHYRVEYGIKFDQLNQSVQAVSSPFVVEGLQNGTPYYFAVKGVSNQGEESKSSSVIIAVTPKAQQAPEPIEQPAKVEMPALEIPPANLYPAAEPLIQVSALGNGALLQWSPEILPAYSGPAYFYRVFFGFESGKYIDHVTTKDHQPTVMIDHLIPGFTYHGRIVALGIDQQEISEPSQEFTFTSTGAGAVLSHGGTGYNVLADVGGHESNLSASVFNNFQLNQVPETAETGSEALWLVLLSLVVGHFFYMHKKKWLKS